MKLSWKNSFEVVWRLAILALPWQTRWFSDASVGGWPWEQGRAAVYASWVLVVATIIFGLVSRRSAVAAPSDGVVVRSAGGRGNPAPTLWMTIVLLFISLIATSSDPLARIAAGQWWLEVVLLAAFAGTMVRAAISFRTLATWILISLVPQIILGFVQTATQHVVGSSWFGIASQLPATPGVSVIEHGSIRLLRMYGGFPHPTIFGGWLAVAVVLATILASTSTARMKMWWWSAFAAVASVALFLTYARAAWIAAIVGLSVYVGAHAMRLLTGSGRVAHAPTGRHILLVIAPSIIAVLIVAFLQRDFVLTRLDATARLEQKSIDTRLGSYSEGIRLVRRSPFFGTGPNAELIPIADGMRLPAPPESPHDVPLLAVVDFGIVGAGILGYLAYLFFTRTWKRADHQVAVPLLVTLVILAAVDHYLWSYWPGLCLAALVILLIEASHPRIDNEAVPR